MSNQPTAPDIQVTFDRAVANEAMRESGLNSRNYQKSLADGLGDCYRIRRDNGKITDIVMEYDACFG